MYSVYLARRFGALSMGFNQVAAKTSGNLSVDTNDDIDDVLQPYQACGFFDTQPHWIFSDPHHRFRHVHAGLPLIAVHQFAAGDSRECDFCAAAESFNTMRHDGTQTDDEFE